MNETTVIEGRLEIELAYHAKTMAIMEKYIPLLEAAAAPDVRDAILFVQLLNARRLELERAKMDRNNATAKLLRRYDAEGQ